MEGHFPNGISLLVIFRAFGEIVSERSVTSLNESYDSHWNMKNRFTTENSVLSTFSSFSEATCTFNM